MRMQFGVVWHDAELDLPATRVEVWEENGDRCEVLISDPALVCDAYGNMRIAQYEEDADVGLRGFVDAGGCVLDAVTHWRSLPDPPGGRRA